MRKEASGLSLRRGQIALRDRPGAPSSRLDGGGRGPPPLSHVGGVLQEIRGYLAEPRTTEQDAGSNSLTGLAMNHTKQHSGPGSRDGEWLARGDVLRPTNVLEALRALDTVTERLLAAGDARAAFPDVYAIITRRVAESVALGDGALFYEPRWVSRLAGRFCERYLETLRWSINGEPQDTGAWEVTYEASAQPGTLPLQHVLLGISAHINFDLAAGIHRTILELGVTDAVAMRRYKHDHDAVNALLRASFPEALDHLIQRHRCEGSRFIYHRAYATAEWGIMRVLERWRERAWHDAMEMLDARTGAAQAEIVQRMEQLARRYARLLSVPMTFHAAPKRPSRGAPSVRHGSWPAQL